MKTSYFMLVALSLVLLSACATVKPYEQIYINDPDMLLTDREANRFVTSFQVYREGASGANGGKSGGGCGCN